METHKFNEMFQSFRCFTYWEGKTLWGKVKIILWEVRIYTPKGQMQGFLLCCTLTVNRIQFRRSRVMLKLNVVSLLSHSRENEAGSFLHGKETCMALIEKGCRSARELILWILIVPGSIFLISPTTSSQMTGGAKDFGLRLRPWQATSSSNQRRQYCPTWTNSLTQ